MSPAVSFAEWQGIAAQVEESARRLGVPATISPFDGKRPQIHLCRGSSERWTTLGVNESPDDAIFALVAKLNEEDERIKKALVRARLFASPDPVEQAWRARIQDWLKKSVTQLPQLFAIGVEGDGSEPQTFGVMLSDPERLLPERDLCHQPSGDGNVIVLARGEPSLWHALIWAVETWRCLLVRHPQLAAYSRKEGT